MCVFLKSFPIFALNILIARPEKPKNERMFLKRPTENGVRAASFIRRLGDFSDLCNEQKRHARIAVFIYQLTPLTDPFVNIISAPE